MSKLVRSSGRCLFASKMYEDLFLQWDTEYVMFLVCLPLSLCLQYWGWSRQGQGLVIPQTRHNFCLKNAEFNYFAEYQGFNFFFFFNSFHNWDYYYKWDHRNMKWLQRQQRRAGMELVGSVGGSFGSWIGEDTGGAEVITSADRQETWVSPLSPRVTRTGPLEVDHSVVWDSGRAKHPEGWGGVRAVGCWWKGPQWELGIFAKFPGKLQQLGWEVRGWL